MEYLQYRDLPLISLEDDNYQPKYHNLEEFVIKNFDDLKNHKINESDISELCEHLIDEINFELVGDFFEYHAEKLYRYLFLYVYYPEVQTYYLKDLIQMEISFIEYQINDLKEIGMFNEKVKGDIISIGQVFIDFNNNYLKTWAKIEPTFEFPGIKEIYEDKDKIMKIIKDFAHEESLVKEFSDWEPVPEEFFEKGEKYNEW